MGSIPTINEHSCDLLDFISSKATPTGSNPLWAAAIALVKPSACLQQLLGQLSVLIMQGVFDLWADKESHSHRLVTITNFT